jgi:hypothetical protein
MQNYLYLLKLRIHFQERMVFGELQDSKYLLSVRMVLILLVTYAYHHQYWYVKPNVLHALRRLMYV